MKLKAQLETESYISQSGYYVIAQQNEYVGEQVVCFSPEQLRHLISDMQNAVADISWWTDGEQDEA